jgi:hypothetical protein
MTRLRVSISNLMCAIVVVSLGLAALSSGEALWRQIVNTITVLLLLFAAIAARYGGPFWYGFAIVGWGIFLLGPGPLVNTRDTIKAPMAHVVNDEALLTSRWLWLSTAHMVSGLDDPQYSQSQNNQIRALRIVTTVQIGHALLSLLFASGGGFIAQILSVRIARERNTS